MNLASTPGQVLLHATIGLTMALSSWATWSCR